MSTLEPDFELVYTMTDYYDGPRRGIADYRGIPHLYESQWDDGEEKYAATFRLSPVPEDLLRVALESWAIWRRWETAFYEGLVPRETHPALPDDRARSAELAQILEDRLRIDDAKAVRARGEFRVRTDAEWNGRGSRPLQVRWTQC